MRYYAMAKPSSTAVRASLALSPDFRHHGPRERRAQTRGNSTMATLTKRQKQLIDYLNQYISDHGYAPTLAEVGAYFGLSSLATVHKHLHNLEKKGFIKRQHNHSRALEVSATDKPAVSRTLKLLGTVAAGA